jgi:hypothetical protein
MGCLKVPRPMIETPSQTMLGDLRKKGNMLSTKKSTIKNSFFLGLLKGTVASV